MGITRMRVELKYRVPAPVLDGVVSRLSRATCRRYGIITTYLDRADGSLSRSALSSPFQCTKVRLREYLDGTPHIWMELKMRSWAWTRKFRFKIEKHSVKALLSGAAPPETYLLAGSSEASIRDVSEAFHRLRELGSGRLVPLGCVTVLRRTFSFPDDLLRFSLDENVRFLRAPERLYENRDSLDGQGDLLAQEEFALLEQKDSGNLPGWCDEIVAGLEVTHYSKFRTLMACLDTSKVTGHVG